ncbi:unnamed protein product, partial [Symbiodinium sp. CCMP2592]
MKDRRFTLGPSRLTKLELGHEMLDAIKTVDRLPSRFFVGDAHEAGQYSVLVFADSVYNFDSYTDWPSCLRLPVRLLPSGTGSSQRTSFLGQERNSTGMTMLNLTQLAMTSVRQSIAWSSGPVRGEAGYMHVKDAWSTILRKQVITHIVDGTQVVLQAEIVVETGCMLSFAISRVMVKDIRALRSISLLPCERYVRILDLSRLWNRRTQSFCGDRRYVNISHNVYESCHLYLSSLAPTSKTYANLLNYMRKAKGGIWLVSKELVAPCNLDPRDHEPLALAVYVRVIQDAWQHEEIITALVESRPKSFFASLAEYTSVQVDWLSSWFSNISMVRSLVEHLTAEGIIRGLVVVPPYERRQVEFFHPEGVGGTVAREIAEQAENSSRLSKSVAARVGSEHGVAVSANEHDGVVVTIPTADGPVSQEFTPAVQLEFGEPFEADEHYCPRCAVMQELGGEQRSICKHLNRPTVYGLHSTQDDVAQTAADRQ